MKIIASKVIVLLALCVAAIGCGDDTTGSSSGGSSGETGSSGGGGSSANSTTATTGSGTDGCAALCALADSSTPSQDGCVAEVVRRQGYPSDSTLSCKALAANKTVAQCNSCYQDIALTDEDCTAAQATCF